MYYSLVHFPDADKTKINNFRSKYDPYFNLINAHISIVFPVPENIGKGRLIEHIENKLVSQKSFDVHISGLEKAWDNWLFIVLKEGREEVIKLHDNLYKGILSEFLRKDIEFIPHIAIGLFTKKEEKYDLKNPKAVSLDEDLYKTAFTEAQNCNFDYVSNVNKFTLVEINEDFSKTEIVREFPLL